MQGWAEEEAELQQRGLGGSHRELCCWDGSSGLSQTEGTGWVFVSLHQSNYLWERGKAASLGGGYFPERTTAVSLGRQPFRELREWVLPSKLGSEQAHHIHVLLDHHQICAHPELEIAGSFLYSILYCSLTPSPQTQMCKKYHIIYNVI